MSKVNTRFPQPFAHYEIDGAFDEMFDRDGAVREHYHAIYQRLLELPAAELQSRQQAADLSFLHQGITFTVYGSDEQRSAFSLTTCCRASSPARSGRPSSAA